jgi:tetratricopeptide (TPR) repeat protein
MQPRRLAYDGAGMETSAPQGPAGPAPTPAPRALVAWCGRALLAAVLVVVAHRALQPMDETDLFFHLKLGDHILEHHRIPFRNLFSFTYPDHPDPDLAWAFQVAVALAYRLGGFEAIVLLKTLLFVGALGLVCAGARRRGAGPPAAALATLLAAWAADQRLVERPHLVTFVGIAALGWGLDWLAARPRRLLVLPPLVAVWANFHAGVFFAPLIVATYAVGLRLEAGAGSADAVAATRRRVRLVLLAAVGCAAAAFASPGGRWLPGYLGWHTGLGSTRNVEEFRVAELSSDPGFFLLVAACAVMLVVMRQRAPWRWALPVVVVAPLAWRSVRFVAEWAILAAPLVATGLALAAARLGAGHARVTRGAWAWTRAGLTLAVAVILVGGVARERRGQPPRLGLAPAVVPFDAIAFATREGLRERMFVNLDVGCYLLWAGWPRYRVFQDARLPAYPDDFHRALDSRDEAVFQGVLRRFDVDAALLGAAGVNLRAGAFDPEEWALVYLDADWRRHGAFVFARRGPRHADVIARREVPLRPRFRLEEGTRLEPLWAPPARAPVPQCTWLGRLAAALERDGDPHTALAAEERALAAGCLAAPAEARVRFRLGAARQLAGDLAAARAHYDRVLALQPAHAAALVNRGYALLGRDPEAARRDLEAALRLEPTNAAARDGLRRLSGVPAPPAPPAPPPP